MELGYIRKIKIKAGRRLNGFSMVPESAGLVTLVDLSSCDEVLAAGLCRDKRALAGTETAPSFNPSCSFSSQLSSFPPSARQ